LNILWEPLRPHSVLFFFNPMPPRWPTMHSLLPDPPGHRFSLHLSCLRRRCGYPLIPALFFPFSRRLPTFDPLAAVMASYLSTVLNSFLSCFSPLSPLVMPLLFSGLHHIGMQCPLPRESLFPAAASIFSPLTLHPTRGPVGTPPSTSVSPLRHFY